MNTIRFTDSEFLSKYLKSYFPAISETEDSFEEAYLTLLKINKGVFADHLKRIRKIRKLTQGEISKKLNITQATYSAWETSKHFPKIGNIKDLSIILEVDPTEFICSSLDELDHCKSIPFLPPNVLAGATFESMQNNIDKYVSYMEEDGPIHPYKKIGRDEVADFIVKMYDRSMHGEYHCLPKYSYLYCDSSCLKGMNHEERLAFANGKVAIVTIKKGDLLVRQVSFNGSELVLLEWRDVSASYKFVKDESKSKNISKNLLLKDIAKIRFELSIKDVEVFALVTKCVQNFEI